MLYLTSTLLTSLLLLEVKWNRSFHLFRQNWWNFSPPLLQLAFTSNSNTSQCHRLWRIYPESRSLCSSSSLRLLLCHQWSHTKSHRPSPHPLLEFGVHLGKSLSGDNKATSLSLGVNNYPSRPANLLVGCMLSTFTLVATFRPNHGCL